MNLTPGSRWKSAVCSTEVVVLKPPSGAGTLECGGSAMIAIGSTRPGDASPSADRSGGTLLGKRYANEARGLEVLCTKAGQGSLSLDGKSLVFRATTPLPSSD
jgi:hypothetical protein